MSTAGGIRAGAAYVELSVKDNRLTRGLNVASARLKAFGAGIAGIGDASAPAPMVNYLSKHLGRVDYRSRLTEGRGLGSGMIEGSIKTLGL